MFGAVLSNLAHLLPAGRLPRTRTRLLRRSEPGIDRTVTFLSAPTLVRPPRSSSRLLIGPSGFVNTGCLFDVSADIIIDSNVYIAHRVLLITSSHELGDRWQRAGSVTSAPITVGRGAWLGAGTVVLPGTSIGDGAVVAAGSVVTRDVEPHTMVAGVPARTVRSLDPAEPGRGQR